MIAADIVSFVTPAIDAVIDAFGVALWSRMAM